MTTYTAQVLGGYNANAPPDDGSTGSINEISWNREKVSLSDPLKNFADALNTEIQRTVASLESEIYQVATTHAGVTAPTVAVGGALWYNTSNQVLYIYHDSAWKALLKIDPTSHSARGYRAMNVTSGHMQAASVGRAQLVTATGSASGTIVGLGVYAFQMSARSFVPMLYCPNGEYPSIEANDQDTGADAPIIRMRGQGAGSYAWVARWRYVV